MPEPDTSALAVSFGDIEAAAEALRGQIARTPCMASRKLSEQTGATVVVKLENLQYTGAFKERGALNKLRSLTAAERARGVIAQSAGNHAQGVAYHAQRLGIRAVIVMPRHTPYVKVERTRSFGAEVILHGETFDETRALTDRLTAEQGLCLVHPYDDPLVIAGQGTIGLEMLDDHPDLDVLVVPVGGGGLISGIAVAAKTRRPDLTIIGVQTERFPSMRQALDGVPIITGTSTIAEGIAVKRPGRLTLPIVRQLVDDVVLVGEADIERAVLSFLQEEKLVAEGAGAAGLAALLKYPDRFAGRRVGLVLCGGNIDLMVLSSIIQRGLARSGRLVRLRIQMRDVPGSLAAALTHIAETGASVVEVHHQRTFTTLPVEVAELEIELITRGRRHVQEIVERLQQHGYTVFVDDRQG
ncbi:threonine ammonia-lyase [Rhodothermaceae bacterium RA]|nr:threonine ammonia-lyase [Rhodothermaceae bacterium RA]